MLSSTVSDGIRPRCWCTKLRPSRRAAPGGKGNGAALEDARKALEDTKAKVAKYEKEKAEIKEKAESIERERDDATKHGAPFGLAVIYLQIAILLSSIAALMKKQPVYWLGLVIGVVGLVYFANGFFLFFKV